MKLRFIQIALFITFFGFQTNAQSFIALSSGISTDLNNVKPFYTIPVTLRWEPFKRSAFFLEASSGIGFTQTSDADAYTPDPQLAEHLVLTEAIKLNTFSVGTGGAIVLYTNKKNNRFTLNLSVGICSEKFVVVYKNYDKANYEVLNPDVSENLSGLYAATAVVYNFHKMKQDMFVMLQVQSPSSATKPERFYPLSYNKTAALQLTFGYKLIYSKQTYLPHKKQ